MTASHAFGPAASTATLEHFVDGDTAATFLRITRRTLLQKVRDGKIPGHALDPSAEKKDWKVLLIGKESEALREFGTFRLRCPA